MRTQQGSSSHVQVQRLGVIVTVIETGRCRPGVVSTGFYRPAVRRGSICKHVISLRVDRELARSSSAAINTAITLSTALPDDADRGRDSLASLPFCARPPTALLTMKRHLYARERMTGSFGGLN